MKNVCKLITFASFVLSIILLVACLHLNFNGILAIVSLVLTIGINTLSAFLYGLLVNNETKAMKRSAHQ